MQDVQGQEWQQEVRVSDDDNWEVEVDIEIKLND